MLIDDAGYLGQAQTCLPHRQGIKIVLMAQQSTSEELLSSEIFI